MDAVDTDGQATDDEALRRLLRVILAEGWDSRGGRELLALVEEHARRWAAPVDRHCGLPYGTTNPHDLLYEAWLVLDRFAPRVLEADAPWAYLWNAVRNAAAVAAAGAAIGSPALAERDLRRCRDIRPPVRVGDDIWRLDRTVSPDAAAEGGGPRWSPALECLLDLIVERGGDRRFWTDAIDRSLDVMADSRRSYEEYDLRRDPYLRTVLGREPEQLSALGALLIGTRRGDRERQSLPLALHRDRTVTPDRVPGATERLGLLLAAGRPPGSAAGTSPPAPRWREPGVA